MSVRISSDHSSFTPQGGSLRPDVTRPPTRPRLRERYDRRRQEVVETCAHVFAQRGFRATSIPDLVEATGLTAGGLYHYIGSKQQLLFHIFEQLMEPLLDRARAIEEADGQPVEQLRELLRVWMAHIERHQDHMLVFAQERHVVEREPGWRDVREQRDAFEAILGRMLERVDQGRPAARADMRLSLLALLGMVNYTPQWFRGDGRFSSEQIADHYCDIIVAALNDSV
jgi:TetR/AcrR family transcriptional regulator, cholesterol catabolism regulator